MKYSQHHDALIPFAKIDTIGETTRNKRRGAILVLVMDHVLDDDVMQQPGSFTEGHALPNDDSSVELKIAGAKDCTKIEAGSN